MNPGEEQRHDDSGGDDGITREHRQHRAIEQADEQRGEAVNDERREHPLQVELAEEGVALAGPTLEAAGGEKIRRVPEAMVFDDAEDSGGNSHRDAARDATADSGEDAEGFDR